MSNLDKHTPKPWVWADFDSTVALGARANVRPTKDGSFQGIWCPPERRVVAVAVDASAYSAGFIDEDSHDARLIIAAPDLLAALQRFVAAGQDRGLLRRAAQEAAKAILKATHHS